ncbi:hypothetical protein M3231_24345 [Neobacillus mesonae]|nr:hypothetical protein [Neobacillus mesonae]
MPKRSYSKVLLLLSMISIAATLVMLILMDGNLFEFVVMPMIVASLYAPNGMLSSMLSWLIFASGYLLLFLVLWLDLYFIKFLIFKWREKRRGV